MYKLLSDPEELGVVLKCRVAAVLSGKSDFKKFCIVRDAAWTWGPDL